MALCLIQCAVRISLAWQIEWLPLKPSHSFQHQDKLVVPTHCHHPSWVILSYHSKEKELWNRHICGAKFWILYLISLWLWGSSITSVGLCSLVHKVKVVLEPHGIVWDNTSCASYMSWMLSTILSAQMLVYSKQHCCIGFMTGPSFSLG